nr:RecX family transcriptional regulator [Helcococcus sueciensis]
MKIENIKYNEKKSIFDIEIEDEKYMISYELYDELNLTKEMEISEKIFKEILSENNYQIAKKIAENYINYKARTEYETRIKIQSKIIDKNVEDRVINYYKKLNLLDDYRYAKDYIEYLLNIKNSSITYIKFKLNSKGIKSNIYNPLIENIEKDIEFKNIKILYEKKYKNKKISDYTEKQKIFRYFAGKGFKFDDINRVLGEFND